MERVIDQVLAFLDQATDALLGIFKIFWTWSFGQIIALLQSDWQALPWWKIAILVVVVAAIVYLLYKGAREIWKAAEGIFKAFVTLLSALVAVLPYVIMAGLIAFAGGFVINNF